MHAISLSRLPYSPILLITFSFETLGEQASILKKRKDNYVFVSGF